MTLIEQMTPSLRDKYNIFAGLMAESRIPFGLNEVLRTKIRQIAYACQGRTFESIESLCVKYRWPGFLGRIHGYKMEGKTIQQVCDIFRGEAEIYLLNGKEWYTVTDTLNSRHFAGADGLARAFDIKIFTVGNKPTWDKKWDADKDGIPEYLEAAEIGRKAGLKAGADFGDYPHYELISGQ